MKRRTFIKRSLPVATLPFLLNGITIKAFGKGSMFEQLLRSATDNDRVLVIVQLTGGNDGLNMVIPIDQYSNLSNARSNIMIPENLVLALNGSTVTGLHPSMTGIQNLFNENKVSIVQGVSYDNPSYSHFRATDIWTTGSDSDQTLTTGWGGRFLDQEYPGYPTGYPSTQFPDPLAIQIGSIVSTVLQGPAVNMGIAITSSTINQLTTGNYGAPTNTPAGHELNFIRETSVQTNAYANRIKAAAAAQANLSTLYPAAKTNTLADQLKLVAQMIGGGLQTKIYMVSIGSFDTHSAQVDSTGGNQTGTHADLLSKVSVAINAFMDDITLMGQQDRVLGMTFSEFGRRIKSNSALGTDHGSSEPMFLFGSKVKGGLTGTNPVIPTNAGVNDNLAMQYDFRTIYASILKNWFCVSDEQLNASLLKTFTPLDLFTVTCASGTGVKDITADNTLLRNYPNPANASTIIEFETTGGNLQMKLYDEVGKELETIVEGSYAAGTYQVEVDTHRLPKGIYLYTLRQNEKSFTKRMLIM